MTALALTGFEVSPAYGYLSYAAELLNVTSTGAILPITPKQPNTTIAYMKFDVLVVTDSAASQLNLFSPSKLSAN